MKSTTLVQCIFLLFAPMASIALAEDIRTLPLDTYQDKVHGAWLGQCIGVTLGTPWEFQVDYPNDVITSYKSGRLGVMPDGCPEQDDILTELGVLAGLRSAKFPLDYSTLTGIWVDHVPAIATYCATRTGLEAMGEGIKGPDSGSPQYNNWWHSIDSQIQGELMGMLTPGMNELCRSYASMMAHMVNYAEGADGGIFVSCCLSEAFFNDNVEKLVRHALTALHPDSAYARAVRDMLKWHEQYPDWHDARDLLATHYADHGKVGAVVNGGAVVLALLYGGGDFEKTICIATMAGWDSDCNPATAGAIVGCMLGAKSLPDKWVEPMKNSYRNTCIEDYGETIAITELVQQTVALGQQVVCSHGATLRNDRLRLPKQDYQVPDVLEEVPGVLAVEANAAFEKWREGRLLKWQRDAFKDWDPDWTYGPKSTPVGLLPGEVLGYKTVVVGELKPGGLPLVVVPTNGHVARTGMLRCQVISHFRIKLQVTIQVNGQQALCVILPTDRTDGRQAYDYAVECPVRSGDAVQIEAALAPGETDMVHVGLDFIEIVE